MDDLAAYGSDSDDSDAVDRNEQKSQERTAQQKEKTTDLSGLLGEYSDDEANAEKGPPSSSTGTRPLQHPEKGTDEPTRKRQRGWDKTTDTPNDKRSCSSLYQFPPPPTSDDTILVQWKTDYFTAKQQQQSHPTKKANLKKLQQIAASASDSGWAQQLKEQHDFHNPHYFESVVEHIGIQEEMGSNLQGERVTSWEFNLQQLEEQARIRYQQQEYQR
jgi:hypothetical protein